MVAHINIEYLDKDKKIKLAELVEQVPEKVKRTVGGYKNMEVAFEIDHKKNPYHSKPYQIPVAYIILMKCAINVMVENGSLSEYNRNSPWAAPTFGVPKNNDKVRIMSGSWKLNEAIKRNPWHMPTI